MVGRTVHQYQFLEKLGSGGMGDIYKAQDTRLGRFVAIKVLTHSATGDPERRKRFIQEAQAASALNHPNIITIHDIVSDEGGEFMVMEYVAGKTLVDLIPKGGLRVPQALKYAVQMADALQTAHQAGIVHRDLKPANVMVTEAGLVKILDFGLAKLTDRGPLSQMNAGPSDETQTINEAPLTVEGSIIGTVSYMSPEQAQGKKVDTRSDIFSFGVVLYEMVTGVRAFEGESALSTLSAILRDEVRPISQTAPDVPPQFEMVISRCLRKQPDDRLQTMKDVQMALSALKHESDSGLLYRARLSEIQPPAAAASASGAAPAPAKRPDAAPAAAKPAPPAAAQAKPGLPAAALAGILAVVVLGAVGGGLWWRHHKQVLQQAAEQAAVVTPAPAPPPVEAAAPPADAPPADAAPAPEPPPAETMTNDTVVDMVKAKVSPTLIMSEIRSAKTTNFTLGPAEVIRLTKAGVPDLVIEQMRNPKRIPSTPPSAPKTVASNTQPKDALPPIPTPQPPPPQAVQQPAPSPQAQPAKPTPPPPTPAAAPPVVRPAVLPALNVTVPDGTPFAITLAQDVPETAEEGTVVRFTVDKEVRIQDTVIIAKGATVTGAIAGTSGKKLGVFGGGKMLLRLNEVDAAGGHKLSVHLQRSGDANRPLEIKPRKSKDIVASAGTDGYVAYINGTQTVSVPR